MLDAMSARSLELFVLPVKGRPVTRYGTGITIGGHRSRLSPNTIEWDTTTIVCIPAAEFLKYRREYTRALRDGSLKKTTAAAWRKQNAPPKPSPDSTQ